MGVATDCSSVSASAPTYVACNQISGGAMLGNWAIGRAVMVMAPMMTVRMAMTIATMGRLMKNLDIGFYLPFASLDCAENGLGFTCAPGRTFCTPSPTTRSPGFNPSSTIHMEPTCSPTFTDTMLTLFSGSTTATCYE